MRTRVFQKNTFSIKLKAEPTTHQPVGQFEQIQKVGFKKNDVFFDFSGLQDPCVMYLIGVLTFQTGDFGDYANNHNQITEIVIQEMK